MSYVIRHRTLGVYWLGCDHVSGLDRWVGSPSHARPFLSREDAGAVGFAECREPWENWHVVPTVDAPALSNGHPVLAPSHAAAVKS